MNRRRYLRVPVEVWVEQWTDRETYHQQSSNLSLGGIYLDRTVPHPEGTLVNLRFSLPGDDRPIVCKGRIVYPRGIEDDFGMGLEFVELPSADEDRIAGFLRKELRRLPEAERRALFASFGVEGLVFEASTGGRGTGSAATGGEAGAGKKARGRKASGAPRTAATGARGGGGAGGGGGRGKGKGPGRR